MCRIIIIFLDSSQNWCGRWPETYNFIAVALATWFPLGWRSFLSPMKANLSSLWSSWQTVIIPSVWLSAEPFSLHNCIVDSSLLSRASKAPGRPRPGTTGRSGRNAVTSCVTYRLQTTFTDSPSWVWPHHRHDPHTHGSYLLRSSTCWPSRTSWQFARGVLLC